MKHLKYLGIGLLIILGACAATAFIMVLMVAIAELVAIVPANIFITLIILGAAYIFGKIYVKMDE